MQMVKCQQCAAPNSAKRAACFSCGTQLLTEAAAAEQALPLPPREPVAGIPAGSVLTGVLAGAFCLPVAIAFLVSSLDHRKRYGAGLLIGFAIQFGIGMVLVILGGMQAPV